MEFEPTSLVDVAADAVCIVSSMPLCKSGVAFAKNVQRHSFASKHLDLGRLARDQRQILGRFIRKIAIP